MDLEISGDAFDVSELRGRAALSELFRFDVLASSSNAAPEVADLVGAAFKLSLDNRLGQKATVRGIVTSAERSAQSIATTSYALALEPNVAALATGRDCRAFQNASAIDVVRKLLEDAGIPGEDVRWSTTDSYAVRPYIAQYRESDWGFVERLLAEEGIYYYFALEDDATILVFADDSTAAVELAGGATIPFHDDDGLRATRDCVVRASREVALASDGVRLRDYSFDKPSLALDAAAGSTTRERYDFPGRFAVPAEGRRRARVRLEALRAERVVLRGETASLRVAPGLALDLTGHPVGSVDGRYLVVAVEYAATSQRGAGRLQDSAPALRFRAIPATTPYRPPGRRAVAPYDGVQTGVVAGPEGEEVHANDSGSVRVQAYWDRVGRRDGDAATWMRVGQVALGGSMIAPRVGWDVLMAHHEGDMDAPFVHGHLYDGRFPVPYALPAHKTRTAWQTQTTPGGGSVNEIRFEDAADAEEIFIHASKDTNVVVGDNASQSVGVDHTVTIGASQSVTVGANAAETIGGSQGVTIGASETLSIAGSHILSVGGAESTTVGASRTVTAAGGVSLDAKGGRTLTVGGTMLAASGLEVSRSVLGSCSVTVGGAWIQAAAAGLANLTGGAGAETVGGAKICVGARGCATSVKGALAETFGGAYVITAAGNAQESATGALKITVGGAMVANAPSIQLEAETEISVHVGGTSLSIKSSSVEIKASSIAAPGAAIKKTASQIHHN